ncbi:probable G-protein coupled receptor 158 [Mercenaria mercenaria]|uniref:probable G-protein coupled receptor 158 n=1 Tax=Mercenaria mercenaria TaxID=6596 RepID=UPI00234F07CB|nr:probable G-protein coupled receptor 158 [Mercenaria mercenaria]
MANFIYVVLIIVDLTCGATALNTTHEALEYVFRLNPKTCKAGTKEKLHLQFDVTVWNHYTDPAIRTANFLSNIIGMNNGTLNSLTDEMLFLLGRNNVHGNSVIFGSGVALEKGVYSKYDKFCPYAHKKNGTVQSHDIAVNYDYLDTYTIWYTDVKEKTWEDVDVVTDVVINRENDHHLPEVEVSYPVAKLSDGHWTVPYFDCGGGNVWMVTYSSPIFGVQNGSVLFRGVATVDIELTQIDINQCDNNENERSSGLDVFRGTHRCQSTTTCVPMAGDGFVPGAYNCVCNDGYYLPQGANRNQSYYGREIENYVREFGVIEPGMFQCTACAAGCTTCVDSSPCLYEINTILKFSLLIVTLITVLGIMSIAVIIYIYRNNPVIKSASPAFLELMCLGGILILSQFFIHFLDMSVLVCTISNWPIHIGFFILYGSLVVKTWRISKIFTIGARQRIRIPDKILYQRIGILVCFISAMLAAWTMSVPSKVVELKTSDNLLYYTCQIGPFLFAFIAAKVLLLLYGVYLSFTIRKAPAQFNDKYMGYAIYNAIILGIAMSFLSRLLISIIGPDLIFVFQFLHLQVFATVTLLIIFVPKFFAIRKKKESSPTFASVVNQISGMDNTHRFRKRSSADEININFLKFLVAMSDKETQTKWKTEEESNVV